MKHYDDKLGLELTTYNVTFTVKSYQNPRKWVADILNDSLIGDEKLLDWEVDCHE